MVQEDINQSEALHSYAPSCSDKPRIPQQKTNNLKSAQQIRRTAMNKKSYTSIHQNNNNNIQHLVKVNFPKRVRPETTFTTTAHT